jgi:hypothetical protein
MRSLFAVPFMFCLVAAPVSASAQDDQPAPLEEVAAEGAAPEATASAAAVDAKFDIRRGLHTEGDFGIFLAFGGTNTNNPELPSRPTSNLQAALGLMVGYDVLQGDGWNLALGGKFGLLLNSGAGRVTDAEIAAGEVDPTTKPNDFAAFQAGAAVHFGYLLTDRLALNVKADGGLAVLDPNPALAASTGRDSLPDAGAAGIGGFFGVGLGVEWFTLLNGFSVGATARFVGILADGMIPGITVTVPVKYNF